jgi:hypothetical protein
MSTPNGTSSSQFAAQAEESLRELLQREEDAQAYLRTQLEAGADRIRRLRKALQALTDEPTTTRPGRPIRTVGDAKVEEIFRAFETIGPTTATQISREIHCAPDTAALAIERLRNEGRLRLVGKTRGGGRLFRVVERPAGEVQAA